MTNGDKMRQQSDRALAAVITCVNCPPRSKQDCAHKVQEPCEECVMCWCRWLSEEAKA